MRYVFIGAGAVGSALGGLLLHSGHPDVLLVARGDHAHAMREGLTVRCPDTAFTVPVEVITTSDGAGLTVDDVLVLTTKTQQAEAALTEWADVPVRGRDADIVGRAADTLPILTASNGVTSEQIALRYFAQVYAVCVWFPAVMIEPGEVIVRGTPMRGVFHIGRYPGVETGGGSGAGATPYAAEAPVLESVSRDWEAAGCLVKRPGDVMQWKYRKLLSNLGNVVQALLGDASDATDIVRAAREEARTIFEAAGISVVSDEDSQIDWQPPGLTFAAVPGEPSTLGGSSWQSLVRGTGTIETDFLNGEIVLIARQHGVPAPVNACLTALARRAARERQQPGALTTTELRSAIEGSTRATQPTT